MKEKSVICLLDGKPCEYQEPDDPDCSVFCHRRTVEAFMNYNKRKRRDEQHND